MEYFEGGAEAGGQMVDQRFAPRIDEGEARFIMIGRKCFRVEHYVYIGGVSGETKTTIYPVGPGSRIQRSFLWEPLRTSWRPIWIPTSRRSACRTRTSLFCGLPTSFLWTITRPRCSSASSIARAWGSQGSWTRAAGI